MLTLDNLLQLAQTYQSALNSRVVSFYLGDTLFDFNQQRALMGVINLSPDSWYRESVCLNEKMALERAQLLIAQGAHIIDIGAESTLPYAQRVDAIKQKQQLGAIITQLAQEKVIISIETYYQAIAIDALKKGAKIINLTGQVQAESVYSAVADFDAAVIICYVQGQHVRDVFEFELTRDPIATMYDYFANEIDLATRAGVTKIFIDAGLGFYYKNLQDSHQRVNFQMQIFLQSFRLRQLGFPICQALPHAFEFFGDEVRSAEGFFAVLAALGQTDLFRTHEVKKVKAILETLAAFSMTT